MFDVVKWFVYGKLVIIINHCPYYYNNSIVTNQLSVGVCAVTTPTIVHKHCSVNEHNDSINDTYDYILPLKIWYICVFHDGWC